MANVVHDPEATDQDPRMHQQAFHGFSKVILFSILIIVLALACLALAFLGNTPVLALLIGLGGTFGLIVAFSFSG
jgi:uncharacterized membrane protein YczE